MPETAEIRVRNGTEGMRTMGGVKDNPPVRSDGIIDTKEFVKQGIKEDLYGTEPKKWSARIDLLKWIAVITMVIDHVGYVFFPGQEIFRAIGRLAFPIFIILLAEGMSRTRHPNAHLTRLWLFGLISQIPFTLLFDTYTLNVLFTMGLAVAMTRFPYVIPIGLVALFMFDFDYGWYGVGIALIYHYMRNHATSAFLAGSLLTILYAHSIDWNTQYVAILGLLIVLALPDDMGKVKLPKMPKMFFHWFYPVHLAVIFLLAILIYG